MGPGRLPRGPVPLSGSAGRAHSSQGGARPHWSGVAAPGPGQGSGEDGWRPHAGLGSARPWGLGLSTAGRWGESRGCLGHRELCASGTQGPRAVTLQPSSCHPPTSRVHPCICPRVLRASYASGSGWAQGRPRWGQKGGSVRGGAGLQGHRAGGGEPWGRDTQPSRLYPTRPPGELPSQPQTEVISATLAPQPFGTQGRW